MTVPHHRHSGGDSGPKLGADDFLDQGTLMQAVGKLQVDAARVDQSYVGFCFVEPTAGWVPLAQAIAYLQLLEARVDHSFVGGCLVQA